MENASRALIMAGGVLIAIMLIAVTYAVMGNISDVKNAEIEAERARQTEEFNRDFLSYDKKLLRGTDLITVVNKAIANNEKYMDQDRVYDIDIHFILQTDVTTITVRMTQKNIFDIPTKDTLPGKVEFEGSKEYAVIDYSQPDRINDQLRRFMALGAKQKDSDDGIYTMYQDEHNWEKVYDNFKVFKRKIFTCKKVEYSSEGRVNLMVFEELKKKDETEDFL